MAEELNLGIYRDGSFYPIPRPCSVCRIQDEWDAEKKKAIRDDGTQVSGVSKNGTTVQVSGNFGSANGTPTITEEDMFASMLALRAKLDVNNNDKFEFFFYYRTSGTPYYRKLKDVMCENFSTDIGDEKQAMFDFSFTLFAEDPVMYTTAPGA